VVDSWRKCSGARLETRVKLPRLSNSFTARYTTG